MENEKFNVVQFFEDDSTELVVVEAIPEKAVQRAVSLATSVGAQIGTTKRVVITDSGDLTNWEWVYGQGLIFPSFCSNAECGVKGVLAGTLCTCGTQTKPLQL